MINRKFIGTALKSLMLLIIVLSLIGCQKKDSSSQRLTYITETKEPLYIALAGPEFYMRDSSTFLDAVNLAVAEVNENGGINGRELRTVIMDDQASVMEGTSIAQRIVEDPKIVAVVGHWNTHVTVPASTTYEKGKVLMLSPIVGNTTLTNRGYEYIFRNIPADKFMGKAMVNLAKDKGYQRIAIYYGEHEYGKGMANAFEDEAMVQKLQIVDRIRGIRDDYEVKQVVERWKALDVDAIFIAESMPKGAEILTAIMDEGFRVPILADAGLDFNLIESLGDYAEGITIMTLFNPHSQNPQLKEFAKLFKEKKGLEVEPWALQGYDSIKLLSEAMTRAKVPTPEAIAQELRNLKEWPTTLGNISFNEQGDVLGAQIIFKVVKDGKFVYLTEQEQETINGNLYVK